MEPFAVEQLSKLFQTAARMIYDEVTHSARSYDELSKVEQAPYRIAAAQVITVYINWKSGDL